MFHNPDPWLANLKFTSEQISTVSQLNNINEFVEWMMKVEYNIHHAVYSIRKINETLGVDIGLKDNFVKVIIFSSKTDGKPIESTPDPDLSNFYDLMNPKQGKLTYLQLIDQIIHARIMNFSTDKLEGNRINGCEIAIGSDHVFHDKIFKIDVMEIDKIIQHCIGIFEIRVKNRIIKNSAQQADASETMT